MAGEWEVVSRNKKDKNTKNNHSQNPPKDQLANPYKPPQPSAVESNKKDNKSQAQPQKKTKKNPETEKQSNKENKKPPTNEIKAKPKSLEQALTTVTGDELWECYNAGANNTTMDKLLDVARYFNTKICVDQNDEIYSKMSLDYPLNVVPPPLKKSLEDILQKDKDRNLQQFLDLCLSSIANKMNNNLPATGYKLIIQILASLDPKIFPNSCAKVGSLMASYQNKPPIGLSILWAIGQVGLKDFNIGVQVWKKAMVPLVDLRNYSKYIISYAMTLLKVHNSKSVSVTQDDFLQLFDFIHGRKKGISKDLEVSLHQQSPVLRKLYFEKSDSWKNFDFFESLLAKLPTDIPEKKQSYDLKTKELLLCLIEALRKKDTAYSQWKNCHEKYSKQSAHVLNYIVNNWASVFSTLKAKNLKDVVNTLKGSYKAQLSKKKDDQLQKGVQLCESILSKMAGSRILCLAFTLFIALPAITGFLIILDVQTAESFDKSNTGKTLDRVGILDYTKYAWSEGLTASARGYKWLEENVPQYVATSVEFSKPYYELTKDLAIVGANQAGALYGNVRDLVTEKAPIVKASIDQYAPTILNSVQEYSSTAWNSVKGYSSQCYDTTSQFLKTKVFVDNWAPEVFYAKTMEAFNLTQTKAVEYYNIFYKYVDEYAKSK